MLFLESILLDIKYMWSINLLLDSNVVWFYFDLPIQKNIVSLLFLGGFIFVSFSFFLKILAAPILRGIGCLYSTLYKRSGGVQLWFTDSDFQKLFCVKVWVGIWINKNPMFVIGKIVWKKSISSLTEHGYRDI